MEPCSTLQVAAEDFVVVFDLLALAPADAKVSTRRFWVVPKMRGPSSVVIVVRNIADWGLYVGTLDGVSRLPYSGGLW